MPTGPLKYLRYPGWFRELSCLLPLFLLWMSIPQGVAAQSYPRPNVLFISIDDMNDATTLFDAGHPIRTPHLRALAARGTFFARAYAASPSCHPSRTSVLTGTRPHRSGVYENRSDARAWLERVGTLPRLFRDSGYFVCGAGKTFHHESDWAFHDRPSFEEYLLMSINEPYPPKKLNGLDWLGTRNTDWGVFPYDAAQTADHRTVDYAVRQLQRRHDRPFFLSVGIYKPHSPFLAPSSYIDAYPLSDLRLPARPPGDMDDLPTGAVILQQLRAATGPGRSYGSGKGFWQGLQQAEDTLPGTYAAFVRAYYACSSFADEMVGRLIRALDESPYRDNTIVVVWSDHGFHLGEKQQIEKFALWEKTTHVPFIILAPGMPSGRRVDRPVDLTTLYPTLAELCRLPRHNRLDGVSLVPLLQGRDMPLPPALMTYRKGNHALRTARWRYIRYADGSEELYDHDADPGEFRNLAGDKACAGIIRSLRASLPGQDAEPVPELR
jgi:arylsulfatase A-like enzyme